jgi:chemosensory pili system protein ChpA (sensor histidine kinase/response regulator)
MQPKIDMIKDFIEEVQSYIPTLMTGLESLKNDADHKEALEESHRLVHTIKGASSLVGLNGLSLIADQMEVYLDEIIAGSLEFSDEVFDTMQKTVEFFNKYCLCYLNGGVASRAMLKETVLNFGRLPGGTVERDETALAELLGSVPENEGLNDTEKTDPGQVTQERSAATTRIPLKAGEGPDMFPPTGSLPTQVGTTVGNEGRSQTTHFQETGQVEIPTQLLESFFEEAEEHLEDLGRSLSILDKQVKETVAISSHMREEIRRIRRAVHTLKGAAAVIGFQDFATYAHNLEDLLDWLFEEASEISPEIVAILAESSDLLERAITDPQLLSCDKAQSLKNKYERFMELHRSIKEAGDGKGKSGTDQNPFLQTESFTVERIQSDLFDDISQLDGFNPSDNVPEMGLRFTKTLKVDMARFDDLVNLSGELIIALSAFDQKMEAFNDSVNDLELYRERLKQIARDLEVSYEVEALEQLRSVPEFSMAHNSIVRQSGNFDDFDTLELDRYSELNLIIRKLNECAVDVGALHTQLSNLHSDFDGRLTRQRVILSELQDKMMQVRMTPMSMITNKLRRTLREVAGNLNKKAKLVVIGENIELDRHIWEKISDPLMHLLRNAVDHGVEPQNLRRSLGKPPVATIQLEAAREGNEVVIRISDDGAGLNFKAIQSKVREMGLSDNVDKMSSEELSQLIFYPGFSTRSEVSQISGRGVGMDVVKENIQNLKGVIQVRSENGKGSEFTIRIPLTLAAVQALLFNVGGQTYAVALNEISEIVRRDPENILGPNKDALRLKDEVLPLFYLKDLTNPEKFGVETIPTGANPVTLVVETNGQRGAVEIDALVGQKEIVIKSLGSHLRRVKGVSGATIMGDGSVIPILNLRELLRSQTAMMEDSRGDLEPILERPLTIMVVDDSVSIRQVVSRLIEEQGWKVLTAKDGIDAFDKLSEHRPDLIVLDIEMPRMNGYEFLGALKTQVELNDIPVVMLTSRTAAKHREKAKALGAKGFIVKPYNDDEFVRLILNLTGRESR